MKQIVLHACLVLKSIELACSHKYCRTHPLRVWHAFGSRVFVRRTRRLYLQCTVAKKRLEKVLCVHRNFNDSLNTPRGYNAIEKPDLVDIDDALVGHIPDVEIVVRPQYRKRTPDDEEPQGCGKR